MIRRHVLLGTFMLGLAALPPKADARDWPQWRGPNRDGAAASFREPASWPEALSELFKVEVGFGYATPILVGDRIYMYTRQEENEVLLALDADSGNVLWSAPYPAPFEVRSAARRHGPGPKSTPVFADGRLFTLGMTGMVTAFDARDRPAALAEPFASSPPSLPYGDVSHRRWRHRHRACRRP